MTEAGGVNFEKTGQWQSGNVEAKLAGRGVFCLRVALSTSRWLSGKLILNLNFWITKSSVSTFLRYFSSCSVCCRPKSFLQAFFIPRNYTRVTFATQTQRQETWESIKHFNPSNLSIVGLVTHNCKLWQFGFFHSPYRCVAPVHDDVRHGVAVWNEFHSSPNRNYPKSIAALTAFNLDRAVLWV